QAYFGPKSEKGPGSNSPSDDTGSDPNVLTSIEFPHYQNFIDAIRTGDPKILTCDILEGHLSATLPHLANISYLVGHSLIFAATSNNSAGTPRNTARSIDPPNTSRSTANAISHPASAPTPITCRLSPTICATTRRAVAPSARRTPISVVRRATLYATTA